MDFYRRLDTDKPRSQNPNVAKMVRFCGLFGIASAISIMGLFDTYLFLQSNDSNSAVGFAESISGLTQVAAVLPAGYLADTYSRSRVLQWCFILSLLYVCVAIVGITQDNVRVIYSALVLGGVYMALQNTTTFALFSDSVPQGDRAYWISRIVMITQISMGIGPLINLLMFTYFGDVWNISVMHTILCIGYLLMVPANYYLLGWQDVVPSPVGRDDEILPDDVRSSRASVYKRRTRLIPYIVCVNDIITCIGAGMTVKFFPLFFKNDYGFSSIQLQLTFTIYCVSFALFTWLCERLAARVGRVQAVMLFSISGVSCLFILAYVQYLPLVLLVFVLRGALQNSIYPIDRSIIMDFVPSSQRGRWSSLESLSAMTWSGSALLGGYLMDTHDYRYTFVITAWIYSISFVLRVPLLFLVPRKEKLGDEKNDNDFPTIAAGLAIASSPIGHNPGANFVQ